MTSRTAATRYAKALLDVASKEAPQGGIEKAGEELDAFAGLVRQNPALHRVLMNPAVPAPRAPVTAASLGPPRCVARGAQVPGPATGWVRRGRGAQGCLVLSRRLGVPPSLYALRLGHRTSVIPAINLANISEFSIVIASLGLVRHQVTPDLVTIVILTFAITSVVSTYMINSNHRLQQVLGTVLKRVGVRDLDALGDAVEEPVEKTHSVVFLGFFRDASSILYELEKGSGQSDEEGKDFLAEVLVIDFNPRVIQELRRRGIDCTYGDIAHIDTLHHAGIEEAQLVFSSITDDILRGTTNLRLMRSIRRLSPDAKVVLTSEHFKQATELYEEGADFVYVPRLYSAGAIAAILKEALRSGFPSSRADAMAVLQARHEVLD